MSADKPVLIDKDKDLLEHTLGHLDVDQIKYYEDEDNTDKIKIVITGTFDDESQAEEFFDTTNKSANEAYERAMRGVG